MAWTSLVWAQPPQDLVQADLVFENTAIQPSQPFWAGVHLKMKEGWHTYWHNPGDAGLATKLTWTLPKDLEAGPIEWPYPQKFYLGKFVNYGYKGEVLLLTRITPKEKAFLGDRANIQVQVEWLACEEVCIPGEATLEKVLPVSSEVEAPLSQWAPKFASTRTLLPQSLPEADVDAAYDNRFLYIHLPQGSLSGVSLEKSPVDFFAWDTEVIQYQTPQKTRWTEEGVILRNDRFQYGAKPPDRVRGVIVTNSMQVGPESKAAFWIDAPTETLKNLKPWTVLFKSRWMDPAVLGGGFLVSLLVAVVILIKRRGKHV